MIKRMIIMLVVVGIVLGGVFGYEALRSVMIKKYFASAGIPPQTVSTTQASSQDWQPQLEAVGSLRAVNGSDLSFQIAGIVDEINFQSGDDVEQGKVLGRLRPNDDDAKLRALQASADLAQVNLARDEKQLKVQAVSQSQVDTDAATLKSAQAQVAQQQALIAEKLLRAPFAGHLGIRLVDLGQYIGAGTAVVTLQALDPIYVDFYLPQQALNQIKVGQSVTAKIDTFAGESFAGQIAAISPRVDTGTRNVQVRATLKNPAHKLLPGMFATVDIQVGTPQRYVTLPQTAIAYNPYGSTLFLIDDKGKDDKGQPKLAARQTFVTTGATRGDQVAVTSGVKDGDVVVTTGQMKLHNGTPVVVNNDVQPANDAHPAVKDQ